MNSESNVHNPRQSVLPVILCGGSGTRLWPASRDSMPKQFIPQVGTPGSFPGAARPPPGTGLPKPVIIASKDVRFIGAEQLKEIGDEPYIVLEPARRDSA